MKKFFIANWKENPETAREAVKLFRATAAAARNAWVQVVVCPPEIYLEKLAGLVRNPSQLPLERGGGRLPQIALGAQDASWENSGAHTGEVGPAMLKNLGAQYVILGHSERRAIGETNETVNAKLKRALETGLRVILCVGEPLAVHKRGISVVKKFVGEQLRQSLAGIRTARGNTKLFIAYEPIWAIGTGHNAQPGYAREMAIFIKSKTKAAVLYGGSVNGQNICDYVQYKEVSGALVGGASLQMGEVRKMIGVSGEA